MSRQVTLDQLHSTLRCATNQHSRISAKRGLKRRLP
jgi:hypothetical protein